MELIERVLEVVLKAVVSEPISVLLFGQEISVNINGKLFNFIVDGDGEVHQVPVPRR